MTRRTKGSAKKGDPEDSPVRQQAWRQAPPRPRKRTRRNAFAVGRFNERKGRGEAGPLLVMPPRAVLLTWLRAGLLLVVAAGVAVGLLYLLQWPLLTVTHATTQIGGAQRISPSEIYDRSRVDGRNILLIDASEVVSAVKSLPGISRVDVHLRLPNQVIIDVAEHAPLVAWQGVTTTVWLASDGSTVPQAGGEPPMRLTDVSEGRLDADSALSTLMLENLVSLHELRPELTEFYYGRSQGLFYRSAQGWEVWLGETGPFGAKLALVDAASQEVAQQGAQAKVIDVRQSDRKALWW